MKTGQAGSTSSSSSTEVLSYLLSSVAVGGLPNYSEQAELAIKDVPEDALNKLLQTMPLASLKDYIERGINLMKNPVTFEGTKFTAPPGIDVIPESNQFWELERMGRESLNETAFVLVAGGLGERLGFNGSKVTMWMDSVSQTSYLQTYIEHILRCEEIGNGTVKGPAKLIIMTSDDTHDEITQFLKTNNQFGAAQDQVVLLKQEKVPAFADLTGKLAVGQDGQVVMKPHGHGDVHTLLHKSKILDSLQNSGFKYLFFFQDTNALSFNALPICLGVMKKTSTKMNFLGINRKANEAVGCLCTAEKDGNTVVRNVEYNLLASLPSETVDSLPGNANVLTFDLAEYKATLERTGGGTPEFINPKFKPGSTEDFSSPARLEAMMQDVSAQYPAKDVSCTVMDRMFCFSTVKNALDADPKKPKAENALTGEHELYKANLHMLELAAKRLNKHIDNPTVRPAEGVNIMGTATTLRPAVTANPRAFVSVTDWLGVAEQLTGTPKKEGGPVPFNIEFDGLRRYDFQQRDAPPVVTELKHVTPLNTTDPTAPNFEAHSKALPNWKVRGFIME